MFDDSFIDGSRKACFLYIDSKGKLDRHVLVVTHIDDDYIEGRSVYKNSFRRFLKCRIIKMYHTESEMLKEQCDVEDIHDEWIDKKNTFEIAFTGFDLYTKKDIEKIAQKNEFIVRTSVTEKLYFLCVGPIAKESSKMIMEAREKNILCITKKQFLHFIDTGEVEISELDEVIRNAVVDDDAEAIKEMIIECNLKFKTIRAPKRSPVLLALFENGYAIGWAFAVKEVFKDALDIKLTKFQRQKNVFDAWTQGTSFSFRRGDTFYSDRLGYSDWNSFIKLPNAVVLKIKYDVYSGYETLSSVEGTFSGEYKPSRSASSNLENIPFISEIQTYDPGKIIVEVLTLNELTNKMEAFKEIEMNQDEFISLLQTGFYWLHIKNDKSIKVNVFEC